MHPARRHRPLASAPLALLSTLLLAAASQAEHPRAATRLAVGEALQRCAAEAWEECRNALEPAREAWPSNFQALYGLAWAALGSGDLDAAMEPVEALLDLGLVLDLEEDPRLAPLADSPRWEALLARDRANAEPVVASTVVATIPTERFVPEGVAFDPGSGALFLGSVHRGRIVRVSAGGSTRVFADPGDGLWSVLGLATDPARRRLWVTTSALPNFESLPAAQAGRTALLAFDLDHGGVLGRYELPEAGRNLNDLTLAGDGTVYVTDNMVPGGLYRLSPGSDHLERIGTEGDHRSPQGLVSARDGRLWVLDYSFGLVLVDPASGRQEIPNQPDDLCLIGSDGLVAAGRDALIVIQNGLDPHRILRLALDPTGLGIASWETLEAGHPDWDEPTLGTLVRGDLVYVSNSGWRHFDREGHLDASGLAEPVLRRIDL